MAACMFKVKACKPWCGGNTRPSRTYPPAYPAWYGGRLRSSRRLTHARTSPNGSSKASNDEGNAPPSKPKRSDATGERSRESEVSRRLRSFQTKRLRKERKYSTYKMRRGEGRAPLWAAMLNFVGSTYLAFAFAFETSNESLKLELAVCAAFAASFVVRLAQTPPSQRASFLTSPINIADALSVFPGLFILLADSLRLIDVTLVSNYLYLEILSVFRVLRVLRIITVLPYAYSLLPGGERIDDPKDGVSDVNSAVFARLAGLGSTVLLLLAFTTSVIQQVEKLSWVDSFYFVLTTISTVGFGDVTAQTVLGRLTVIALIIIAIVTVPVQVGQLNSLLSSRRVKLGDIPWEDGFVLVLCELGGVQALRALFTDLYKSTPPGTRIVILTEDVPDYEYQAFQEVRNEALTIVQGSALSDSDLLYVRAQHASSWVLLTGDKPELDRRSVLKCIALKRHAPVPLFVQVCKAESMLRAETFLNPATDNAISTEQLRMQLASLNVITPGAAPFLANLLRSVNPSEQERAFSSADEGDYKWMLEYAYGVEFEFYYSTALTLPPCFMDVPFRTAAKLIYDVVEGDCFLIGIYDKTRDNAFDTNNGVMLNPDHLTLRGGEVPILLAKDEASAALAVTRAAEVLEPTNDDDPPPPIPPPPTASLSVDDADLPEVNGTPAPPVLVYGNLPREAARFTRSMQKSAGKNVDITWITSLPATEVEIATESMPSVRTKRVLEPMIDEAEKLVAEPDGPKRFVSLTTTGSDSDDSEAILCLYGVGTTPGVDPTVMISKQESVRFLTGVGNAIYRSGDSESFKIRSQLKEENVPFWQSNAWFAAGCVLPSAVFDTFAAQCSVGRKNPRILEEVINQMSWGNGRGAMLRTTSVPTEWIGAPFKEVLTTMIAEYGSLPLALFRRHPGPAKTPERYLVSCPSESCIVTRDDVIIYLEGNHWISPMTFTWTSSFEEETRRPLSS
ncbi:calcium-activated potassium channel [Pycnococcus provasolii]